MHNLNIKRVPVSPYEANAVLIVYSNTVLTCAIPAERL